jgi:putative ABC transport system permease protein
MFKVNSLHKKLLRQMWRTRGQTLAVISVVLCGTACLICLASAHRNLLLTRDTYYADYRLADFEIRVERAPLTTLFKLETIPGVRQVRGRIVEEVNLDIPDVSEPRTGRIVSMPDKQETVLNDVLLTKGRWFSDGAAPEVVLSEDFAGANNLTVGDRFEASINNKKYNLKIVGLGLSPEYVYIIRNIQEMVPAPERFGILWIPQTFAENAMNMGSACNSIIGTAESDDDVDAILNAADKMLDTYGVFVTWTREDMISPRFLRDELRGLETTARVLPMIFLGISSLILLVVLNRMVRKERTQIGLMKAYGYSNFAVAFHYIQFALILGAIGCLGGFVLGQWLAAQIMGIYNQFYAFPVLMVRVHPDVVVRSMGTALAFATMGAVWAALQAAGIDPATSMRPEAPKYAHRTLIERINAIWSRIGFTSKMIVRNISRNKFRAALNIGGVMVSTGLVMSGNFSADAIAYVLDYQFYENRREDIRVNLALERGKGALFDLGRYDHVRSAEPMLQYPFELKSEWHKVDTLIVGFERDSNMHRIMNRNEEREDVGETGLVLTERLAESLGVQVGDFVRAKPLMGRVTKEKDLRVSKIVRQYLGNSAYMNIDALSRVLDEPFALNTVLLKTAPGHEQDVNRELKDVPAVSAVEIKRESFYSLKNTIERTMRITNGMVFFFAAVISFSVIYNVTTVSLAERERELASLRVLGFSEQEVGRIMFDENFALAAVGILFGIPFGIGICWWIVDLYSNELYRFPLHLEARTYVYSVFMTLCYVALANLAVRHKIKTLNMVEVLKERE